MDEIGTGPTRPRKHMLAPEALARAATVGQRADLTRKHGQGNGLRVHTLYFVMVSLAALAMMIAAVVVANTTP